MLLICPSRILADFSDHQQLPVFDTSPYARHIEANGIP